MFETFTRRSLCQWMVSVDYTSASIMSANDSLAWRMTFRTLYSYPGFRILHASLKIWRLITEIIQTLKRCNTAKNWSNSKFFSANHIFSNPSTYLRWDPARHRGTLIKGVYRSRFWQAVYINIKTTSRLIYFDQLLKHFNCNRLNLGIWFAMY